MNNVEKKTIDSVFYETEKTSEKKMYSYLKRTKTDSNQGNEYKSESNNNSEIIYKKQKRGIFNISRCKNKKYIKKQLEINKIKENVEIEERTSDENIEIKLPNNYPKTATTMSKMNNKIKREQIQENYEKLIKLRNNSIQLKIFEAMNINNLNSSQSFCNNTTNGTTMDDVLLDEKNIRFAKKIPIFNGMMNYSIKKYYLKKHNFVEFIIKNEFFKKQIFKFLDIKNISILSQTNKKIYKICQNEIYNTLYIQLIIMNNIDLIEKIKRSIFKYSKFQKSNYIDNLYTKSKYNNLIEKDLTRTFPGDKSFKKGNTNYNKLYFILKAYSNYNKIIGYAQGLNFLAGNAIFFFDTEEEVIIFIDGMINKFELEKYMGIKYNKLDEKLNDLGNFLKSFFKKYNSNLLVFLEKNYVTHEFFTANWLLTLFSNGMDRNNLLIVWCFLILFGWKFFYFFVLEILFFFEEDIKKTNETKISNMMKTLLKNDKFKLNFNIIIEKTFTLIKNNLLLN